MMLFGVPGADSALRRRWVSALQRHLLSDAWLMPRTLPVCGRPSCPCLSGPRNIQLKKLRFHEEAELQRIASRVAQLLRGTTS
jgi:hypothetical protein